MKQTLILLVTVFLLTYANAQQVQVGVKGGVNISDLHYNNNTSANSNVGLNFGVLAHIHASEKWALQPELMYSLEGATFQETSLGTVHTHLNYLNVPVLLQYMMGNGFRFEGGPQIDFLLNSKSKAGNVSVTTNSFQSTGISIPLGISYLTANGIGLDARYVFGLSNINGNKNGPDIQSNVFQLGIFYQVSDAKMHKRH